MDEIKPMLPHQQRVLDEAHELKQKVQKLNAFVDTTTFENLEAEERTLLCKQLNLMVQYFNVLELRIARF